MRSKARSKEHWLDIHDENFKGEPIEANPDQLSESDTLWPHYEESNLSKVLHKMLPDLLTVKQFQVYLLLYRKGLSEREVGKKLRISHTTVNEYHKAIKRKVKNYVESLG